MFPAARAGASFLLRKTRGQFQGMMAAPWARQARSAHVMRAHIHTLQFLVMDVKKKEEDSKRTKKSTRPTTPLDTHSSVSIQDSTDHSFFHLLRLPQTKVQKRRRINRARPDAIRRLGKVIKMRRSIVVVKVRVDRPADGNGVQPGQLCFRGRNETGKSLERLAAFLRREGGPRGEGGLGGGDGGVDVLGGGFADWIIFRSISQSSQSVTVLGAMRMVAFVVVGVVDLPFATRSPLYGECRSKVASSEEDTNCSGRCPATVSLGSYFCPVLFFSLSFFYFILNFFHHAKDIAGDDGVDPDTLLLTSPLIKCLT